MKWQSVSASLPAFLTHGAEWVSYPHRLLTKCIVSSVVLSRKSQIAPPPFFFLARVLWSSSHESCLFFRFLGTVKDMCFQQMSRHHGEMESRLEHESAGLGLTLHVSGRGLSSSKSLRSSMASMPVWRSGQSELTAASSGLSWNPMFTSVWVSCPGTYHLWLCLGDSLEKGPHLSPKRF